MDPGRLASHARTRTGPDWPTRPKSNGRGRVDRHKARQLDQRRVSATHHPRPGVNGRQARAPSDHNCSLARRRTLRPAPFHMKRCEPSRRGSRLRSVLCVDDRLSRIGRALGASGRCARAAAHDPGPRPGRADVHHDRAGSGARGGSPRRGLPGRPRGSERSARRRRSPTSAAVAASSALHLPLRCRRPASRSSRASARSAVPATHR